MYGDWARTLVLVSAGSIVNLCEVWGSGPRSPNPPPDVSQEHHSTFPRSAARRNASMARKIPPLLSEKLQRKQNDKGCSCKLHIGENPEMKCGQFFVASDGTPQNKRRDHPTPALLDPPAACLRASLSAMSAEASAKTSGSSSLMLFAMEVLVFML